MHSLKQWWTVQREVRYWIKVTGLLKKSAVILFTLNILKALSPTLRGRPRQSWRFDCRFCWLCISLLWQRSKRKEIKYKNYEHCYDINYKNDKRDRVVAWSVLRMKFENNLFLIDFCNKIVWLNKILLSLFDICFSSFSVLKPNDCWNFI